jgi:hypothetical protein
MYPAEYCLSQLGHLYRKRQKLELGKKLAEDSISEADAFNVFQELCHQGNGAELPKIELAAELCSKPPLTPPEIIEAILHQGSKMLLGGGSKSFKSWSLLQLSLCISAGLSWLGFKTVASPVLYLNFELPRFAIAARLNEIANALEIQIPENFSFWNLRGYATEASKILPVISRGANDKGFRFIVIDPLYKLLGSKDENLSRDMAELMNQIEHLAVQIEAAVASGLHFAKGNASFKEAIDRIAGSGVFGRDPDSIVTFTQHEEPDAFSVDMILRNFPPQDPFVVRRRHPLMIADSNLDPAKLKKPIGRPPTHEAQALLDCLNRPMTSAEWQKAALEDGISRPTFFRLRKQLVTEGRVFQSQIDEKWNPK